MKTQLIIIAGALAALLLGCARTASGLESSGSGTEIPGLKSLRLGEPITAGQLTLVPVLRKQSKEAVAEDYITLSEAKKNGWVEIIEIPGEEQVSALMVRNLGPRPLLLLGGELLLGGKQDRVVAKDTIVPPNETLKVQVFCVEQGRWTDGPVSFKPGYTSVPQSVREAATYDRQEDVWDRVGEYNQKNRVARAGNTTVAEGLADSEVQRIVATNLPALSKGLGKRQDVVGVVVVIGGDIKSLEMFGNTKLFQSAIGPLLKGFLAEAAVAKGSPKAFTMAECAEFVKAVLQADRRQSASLPGSEMYKVEGRYRGVEIGARDYKGAAAESPGFIHGTYSK